MHHEASTGIARQQCCALQSVDRSEQANLESQDADQVAHHSDTSNDEQEVCELSPAGTNTAATDNKRIAEKADRCATAFVVKTALLAPRNDAMLFLLPRISEKGCMTVTCSAFFAIAYLGFTWLR